MMDMMNAGPPEGMGPAGAPPEQPQVSPEEVKSQVMDILVQAEKICQQYGVDFQEVLSSFKGGGSGKMKTPPPPPMMK